MLGLSAGLYESAFDNKCALKLYRLIIFKL